MSVRKVLSAIAGRNHQDKATAAKRYVEILHSSDKDTPALTDELEEVMNVLGKTATEAMSDHGYIEEAKRKEGRVLHGLGLEKQIEAARLAIREYMAESKRIEIERDKELARLRGINNTLTGRQMSVPEYMRELEQHCSARGTLFIGIPMPIVG